MVSNTLKKPFFQHFGNISERISKFTIVILISISTAYPQSQDSVYVIQAKSNENRLWGYVDIKGDWIIEPKFKRCDEFTPNGYAAVYLNLINQWVYMKLNGQYLINTNPGTWFTREPFIDGLTQVRGKEGWGFINEAGEIVIPTKFKSVGSFNGGYCWGKMNGGSVFILDSIGGEKEITIEGLVDVNDFSEGLAPFEHRNKLFGFINTSGEVKIYADFQNVGFHLNGLAWARTTSAKVGFLDKEGNWVIDPQYEEGFPFDPVSGLARVRNKDYRFYINRTNKKLIINDTDLFGDFSEGLAMGRQQQLYGFYNDVGTWVIPPQFQGVRDFKNGFAAAKKFGLWGLINKSGEWVIEPKFDSIKDVERVLNTQ